MNLRVLWPNGWRVRRPLLWQAMTLCWPPIRWLPWGGETTERWLVCPMTGGVWSSGDNQMLTFKSETGDFYTKGGIDIKKGGIFPIVHGVRTMALDAGLRETSTHDRLSALARLGRLDAEVAEDLGEALSLFSELRLKAQLRCQRDDVLARRGTAGD